MNTKTLLLLALTGCGFATATVTETDMKPCKVAIFKNNYGFITMQGELGNESSTRLTSLPVPSLGTFWIWAEEGARINSLVSGLFDYEETLPADMKTLAAANAGSKVQVSYYMTGEDTRMVEGTLLPFPKANELSQGNTIGQISTSGKNAMIGNVLLLKTETSTLALDMGRIISIDYMGDINLPTKVNKRPCVELQLAQAAPSKKVQATCLSQGITWLPSYNLELGEDGKAILNAKATITNNLIDLEGVEMELITGYPSLNNQGQIDPMAMERAMADSLPTFDKRYSNRAPAPSALRSGSAALMDVESSWAVTGGSAAAGTDTGNLFFYPVAQFTAKVGQVVTQPLFSETIDYKHVYTWLIEDPSYFREHIVGLQQEPSTIWDCIRFTNPLNMPLTAAPIEFTQKGRISGTNDLSYTPSKTECTVRMGRAINFVTSKSCKVIKQEVIDYPSQNTKQQVVVQSSDPSKSSKVAMTKVTKNSCLVTLSIKNPSDKPVDMEITQEVKGHVTQVGQNGHNYSIVRAGAHYLDLDNIITWRISIPANSTQELEFNYDCIR